MRVVSDHPHDWRLRASHLDESVERRGKRIFENAVKRFDCLNRGSEGTRFVGESFTKEEQPCGSKIGLGLDLLMAVLGQRVGVVPKHHVLVPRNEAVTDFMRLVPAMFLLRQARVQKNPFPIRKVKCLKRSLPDRLDEQRRPTVDLDGANTDPMNYLACKTWIICSIKGTVELQQIAHVGERKGGAGITEPP